MPVNGSTIILGIESSCDDTAAAVLVDGVVKSNVVAGQDVHREWGGVVPELASRAHQENIVPVVHQALKKAGISKEELSAVAFTQGPGLMGSLLVGACFARSFAQGLGIPLIAVDHLKAHVLAHFITDDDPRPKPEFPFINLTVSGGHTQLILVRGPLDMEIIGTTVDDAAGEAFDKGAKVMGLPYPGGPLIDKYAVKGDPKKYKLPEPQMAGFNMSFSGIKTAFRDQVLFNEKKTPGFINAELPHLCGSLQATIVDTVLKKLYKAARAHGIPRIAISGGVSANSSLRMQLQAMGDREGWAVFIPPFAYCTDNAAMIAISGHYLYQSSIFAALDTVPMARW
ncbi:MAG: tRNA (adenosine(37)-N6)-threonylcarbamoyltransferase complex transferase subunit TsaD [Flavobacteriales bacterium]|jgi:N6-L-threonylcarbamoyladenine synthase